MTNLYTTEDLLRAARENQEFREAFRREILTEELIRLPVRFGNFERETNDTLKRIESDLGRIENDLGTTSRRLDSLRGYALEDVMASRLRQRLRRDFELKRVRVIWQASRLVQPLRRSESFHDSLDTAQHDGRISDSEYTRIEDTDMVVTALRNSDDSRVYISVEASGIINDIDIVRARQSAGILNKMYNEDAIPAVYGFTIEAPQINLASANPEEGKEEVHIFLEDDNL